MWSSASGASYVALGLKVGEVSHGRFEARVRELADGHAMLAGGDRRPPSGKDSVWSEFTRLHREMITQGLDTKGPITEALRDFRFESNF
jgi:hypothetical protein